MTMTMKRPPRYYLVGPDDDDGDGSWRGVFFVMGS
jgi:hypothetical protein